MRIVVLSALVLASASCGKKPPAAPVVLEGWHQLDGWQAACYFPPNYKDSDRLTQNTVRDQIMGQWRGDRDDGFSISDSTWERIETALLGKPDAVKSVAKQNLDHCRRVMGGESSMDTWKSWVNGLASGLTEGDCPWPPLRYQQHDYLEVDQGWQFEGRVCKGDRIRIEVSSLDFYRISDNAPWINAEGDTSQAALGDKYECTIEGCYVGTVIYRFTDEQGVTTIGPVGTGIEWTAPDHGRLHLQVNDDGTWYDNVWRKKGSLIDHAAIAYVGLD